MSAKDYLDIISKTAPLISALTAIVAAIFISRQIVNIRRNREVDTLFKVITLADSERMFEAKNWLLYERDKYPTLQQLKADREAFRKFSHMVHLFETMGVIVNNGYVSENLIFDKYGLFIIGAWDRLRPLIDAVKAEWQSEEYAENFAVMVSKYDEWIQKTPLKAGRGDRLQRRHGRDMLNYENDQRTPGNQLRNGSSEQ